jgi:hypothetical protein
VKNRRTLTVNQQPRRRPSLSRPTCGATDPKASHRRCVLDAGHRNDHFADGLNWDAEEAA